MTADDMERRIHKVERATENQWREIGTMQKDIEHRLTRIEGKIDQSNGQASEWHEKDSRVSTIWHVFHLLAPAATVGLMILAYLEWVE